MVTEDLRARFAATAPGDAAHDAPARAHSEAGRLQPTFAIVVACILTVALGALGLAGGNSPRRAATAPPNGPHLAGHARASTHGLPVVARQRAARRRAARIRATPAARGRPSVLPARTPGALPLIFERNVGQSDPHVDFVAHGAGYGASLTRNALTLTLGVGPRAQRKPRPGRPSEPLGHLRTRTLSLQFLGASAHGGGQGAKQLQTRVTALGDRRRPLHAIPAFAGVSYRSLYPGIDLRYHSRGGSLEYDLALAPGAQLGRVRLGLAGADLRGLADGALALRAGTATLRMTRPRAYQRIAGRRQPVAISYRLLPGGRIGFAGRYDHRRALLIDPELVYSSRLGQGLGAGSLAVDASGATYVAGSVWSAETGADAFVGKLAPDGQSFVYLHYLGGSSTDSAASIAIDSDGAAYITGTTYSTDFPTMNGFQTSLTADHDGFVAKLAPDGQSVDYATYLGGLDTYAYALAVDPDGAAYVTGEGGPPATPGAFQTATNGSDAFVSKLAPDGSGLDYSTYLGSTATSGCCSDWGYAIAADADGSAYVAGQSTGGGFPTTAGAFQRTFAGEGDAFVTKLDPDGASLAYSTYLGGSGGDVANAVAVDADGAAYVAGYSDCCNGTAPGFPTTAGALQRGYTGNGDGFVTKLAPDGASLTYSTLLGGADYDEAKAIAVDASKEAYVVGGTYSSDFPSASPIQAGYNGSEDAFVTKLNPSGSGLEFSSWLGGSDLDLAGAVALDPSATVDVVGVTYSSDFPTVDPLPGAADGAFLAKVDPTVTGQDFDGPAVTFRPLLRFDTHESWRPLNLDRFLAEVDPTRPGRPYNAVCDASSCNTNLQSGTADLASRPAGFIQVGSLGPGGTGGTPDDYRSPDPACSAYGLWDCDSGPDAGIYYHVVRSSTSTYDWLDYWTYYRYNDLKGLDHHEGDWEGAIIAINSASAQAFDAVGMAQHNGVTWELPGQVICDAGSPCGTVEVSPSGNITVRNVGRRVHVFVADGSHAAYPGPCHSTVLTGCRQDENVLLPEGDHDGAWSWGANADPSALLRFPDSSSSWTFWNGHWGSSCSPSFNCDGNICNVTPPCNSPKTPSKQGQIQAQDRFNCPGRGNPLGVVEPCAVATRAHSEAEFARWSASMCSRWFSASHTAVACSPSALRQAVATGSLGRRPLFTFVPTARRRVGAGRGVSQIGGAPLAIGQALVLRGTTPRDTVVAVTLGTGRMRATAVFHNLRMRHGSAVIRAVRSARGLTAELRVGLSAIRRPDAIRRDRLPRSGGMRHKGG
jgi:hypothetical protein